MTGTALGLDEVYRKFGEAAEAAQLIETELSTMLMMVRGTEAGLLSTPDPARATALLDKINRHTLGQLIRGLNGKDQSLDALDELLTNAREARNRLFHSFYRKHNFRRNSDAGRAIMLADLESIHGTLLAAYDAILRLSGVDPEAMAAEWGYVLPAKHVPLR